MYKLAYRFRRARYLRACILPGEATAVLTDIHGLRWNGRVPIAQAVRLISVMRAASAIATWYLLQVRKPQTQRKREAPRLDKALD